MEWRRLASSPYHRLEFETTLHFLERYLPRSGLVLDAGGGPGRYTIELARRGYEVVLLDLAPANLRFAEKQVKKAKLEERIKQYVRGSIDDLSRFDDGSFDAVLCLGGPLSHILDRRTRTRAVSELIRVCKNGGNVFASVIGGLAVLVAGLTRFQDEIASPHFKRIAERGDYYGGRGFTRFHGYTVEELRREFDRKNIEILGMAGLEGVSSGHERELNRLRRDPRLWRAWMRIHYDTCTDRSVAEMSEHMLIICRKLSNDR
jgi:SAM-dependent methyltransferase